MKALRLGSLSNRLKQILTVSADFVAWQSPFHTGTTLMLNVFFLLLVLLYLTNNLCSECLVTLDTALKMPSKLIRILRITFCYKQLCGRCLVHMTPVVKVVMHCVFALL